MVGGVDRATINCVKRIDRIASEDPDEDSCRWTGHCASINRRSQYATDLIDCVVLSKLNSSEIYHHYKLIFLPALPHDILEDQTQSSLSLRKTELAVQL